MILGAWDWSLILTLSFSCTDSVNITNLSAKVRQSGSSAIVQFSCCAYGSPAPGIGLRILPNNVLFNSAMTTHGHLSTCTQGNFTVEKTTTGGKVKIICSAGLPYQHCSKPGEQYCKDNVVFIATRSVSAAFAGETLAILLCFKKTEILSSI